MLDKLKLADVVLICTQDKIHFKQQNASAAAPNYCLEGGIHSADCLYYAPKTYLTVNEKFKVWQTLISDDDNLDVRTEALKKSSYGRCAYKCDNNVVDNQVVNFEFANGVTATFTMCTFSYESSRKTNIMGTKGQTSGNIKERQSFFRSI